MDWTSIVAERQIQEAMESGEFDDNPLKGQPLDLTEEMAIPPHERVAARLLKNANVLPDWAQLENDIREERTAIESLRERGIHSHAHARKADLRGRIAARLRRDLPDRMRTLNTLILRYNMSVPAGYGKTFLPMNAKEELAALERALSL